VGVVKCAFHTCELNHVIRLALSTTVAGYRVAVGDSDHHFVGEWQAAQAVEFSRALQVQLRKMTSRLAWVERQGVTDRNSREMRLEAAALRRDIKEAQVLIDRLQLLYLNSDRHTPSHADLYEVARDANRPSVTEQREVAG
jgi:hypothetical protein